MKKVLKIIFNNYHERDDLEIRNQGRENYIKIEYQAW